MYGLAIVTFFRQDKDNAMFPFVTEAYAQSAGGGIASSGGIYSFIYNFTPILIVILILWVGVFRPQQKKLKLHRELLASIAKGDEVKIDSGIFGIIQKITDNTVHLEIAPKVVITVERYRVAEMVKAKKEDKKED